MHIMYIAPMFHTNQLPIIKGWLEQGHIVTFISHYEGKTEDHSSLVPTILGYSRIFTALFYCYKKITSKSYGKTSYPEAFQDKCGFPSLIKTRKILKEKSPSLIILRERSLYSITCYLIAKSLKIPCVLYNQTPLWENNFPKRDLAHRIVWKLTPPIRMTPVYGNETLGFKDRLSFYVPFVVEPNCSFEQKPHFLNHRINLLCVGKFETRKHQLMLLRIFSQLQQKYSLTLTLVGEVSTQHHKEYFNQVLQYINANQLESSVFCYTNCNPSQMEGFYRNADLFILPSTGEFASISQLEAMSYSLPVVLSDTNGSACYIENEQNGYLFSDQNELDLFTKLDFLLSNEAVLLQMGKCSYDLVIQKYSFKTYFENIVYLLSLLRESKER